MWNISHPSRSPPPPSSCIRSGLQMSGLYAGWTSRTCLFACSWSCRSFRNTNMKGKCGWIQRISKSLLLTLPGKRRRSSSCTWGNPSLGSTKTNGKSWGNCFLDFFSLPHSSSENQSAAIRTPAPTAPTRREKLTLRMPLLLSLLSVNLNVIVFDIFQLCCLYEGLGRMFLARRGRTETARRDGVSRQTDTEKWAESTFCFPKPVLLHLAA